MLAGGDSEVAGTNVLDRDLGEPVVSQFGLKGRRSAERGVPTPKGSLKDVSPLPLAEVGVKFLEDESARGREDAPNLPQRPFGILDVMGGDNGRSPVEIRGREGDLLRLAGDEADVRSSAFAVRNFPSVWLQNDDLLAPGREDCRVGPGPSTHVQETEARLQGQGGAEVG